MNPGTMIGSYRLDHQLGEGGMGVVHQATDTKLNRLVAIKFLSTDLADADARRRFQREAQLASSLNHPHILTVHDAGEVDGRQYLVTELIDGGTLRDWIRAGPRSWQDIVEMLVGVADGLATAHEAGIMHRDVKPANILVTRSGYTKLADFGLAKLYESPAAITRSVTEARTLTGGIIGTVAYMSPEQASGRPVDARSDVFSFAVVLYEMLAGRRPFAGPTDLDVLHAVAHQPIEPLPETVPRSLRALIEKSLEKDPAARTQSMRELVVELRRLARHGATTPARETGRSSVLKWAAASIAFAVVVASVVVMFREPPPPSPAVSTQYIQLTNFADAATSPALSPDGTWLTFIRGPSSFFSQGQIWVKRLPDGEARQLTSDEANKMGPQFTPDGQGISYTRGSSLEDGATIMDTLVVAVGGGPPRKLLENAEGLTWFKDRDGQPRVLFSEMTGLGGQMSIVSSTENRSAPRNIYVPPPPSGMAHRSYLSPDGGSVLIVEMDGRSWLPCRVVPFDRSTTGTPVGPILSQCNQAAWSPDGQWMFFTANTGNGAHIWRQRFPDGTPEQITFSAASEEGIHFAPDGRSFVTSIGTSQSTVWVHDARGDRQITQEGYGFQPTLSPDGQKLYYLVREFGGRSWNQGELWVVELTTGQRRRLLPGFQLLHFSISRDGRRVVFSRVDKDGHSPVWLADLDGDAPPRQLTSMAAATVFFGAPGEILFSATEDFYVFRISEDGRELQKVIPTPLFLLGVSPDGRWIAVQDGRAWGALFVYPTHGGSPRRLCDRCSPPWGVDPMPFYIGWTFDGKFLYWKFANATYAIPLPANNALPPIPAAGLQSKDGVAAIPGARLIAEQDGVFPGPNPSLYAFMKVSTQRNIYRVPVP